MACSSGPHPSPACERALACGKVLSPKDAEKIEAGIGASSDCWSTTPENADKCTAACNKTIADLDEAVPNQAADAGCGNEALSQSPACRDLLGCAGSGSALESLYGERGMCWATTRSYANACTSACAQALQQLRAQRPDAGCDGTAGSGGTAGGSGTAGGMSGAAGGMSGTAGGVGTAGGHSGAAGGSSVMKRVFVTASDYDGKLGGLAGADAKCALSAQAANLGGTWKAWLSDDTTNALDRIANVGPWFLLDGTKVFNNKANLATVPLSQITISEQGTRTSGSYAWTGTLGGGARSPDTCGSWAFNDATKKGNVGYLTSASNWTEYSAWPCSYRMHLYCIEQ